MKKIINNFLITILLILLFCSPVLANKKITYSANEQAKAIQVQYEYLIKNTNDFRNFVQNERKEHREFLEDMYKKIVWFFGIFAALFCFFGIRSFNDAKRHIEELVEKRITKEAEIAVEKANKKIEDKITEVEEEIKPLLSYKQGKIFIYNYNNNSSMRFIIKTLKEKGIKNIEQSASLNQLSNSYCLVVFNLKCDDIKNVLDDKIKECLSYIKDNNYKMPLIIFSDKFNIDVLNEYDNYCMIANSKTPLIDHIYSMLKMFC